MGIAALVLSIVSASLAIIPFGFFSAGPFILTAIPLAIIDLLQSKKAKNPITMAIVSLSFVVLGVLLATAWIIVVDIDGGS